MKYLLDTNTIIRLLSHPATVQLDRFAACDAGDLVTLSIALVTIALGSNRGKPPHEAQMRALLEEVEVLPIDLAAARQYALLPFRRRSYDRLIAAHALSPGLAIVTDNERDFADVPRLAVENWSRESLP